MLNGHIGEITFNKCHVWETSMLEDTLIKCINGNKFSKLCLLILTCSKKIMIEIGNAESTKFNWANCHFLLNS